MVVPFIVLRGGKRMSIVLKSNFLLKTSLLTIALFLMAFSGISIASSKPKIDPDSNLLMDTRHYERINPKGNRLGNVTPPRNISTDRLIPCKDDRSCGSAALASILKHSFNVDVNEMDVITGLLTYGDRKSIIKRAAFSFYDMKRFLSTIGYNGTGYTISGHVSCEQLKKDDFDSIKDTTIIPVKINGYSHFTVYRAYDDRYIYLGSPLYGNICLTFEDLGKVIVKRSIFVVRER